jgi:DNA-binding response OmpR family regulator
MHIFRLRRKLEAANFKGAIRTIRHSGYLFTPDRELASAKGVAP